MCCIRRLSAYSSAKWLVLHILRCRLLGAPRAESIGDRRHFPTVSQRRLSDAGKFQSSLVSDSVPLLRVSSDLTCFLDSRFLRYNFWCVVNLMWCWTETWLIKIYWMHVRCTVVLACIHTVSPKNGTPLRFWLRNNIVKRDICGQKFCPSFTLMSCALTVQDIEILFTVYIVRLSNVSSLLGPNL